MEHPRTPGAVDASAPIPGQRSLWSILTRRPWIIGLVTVCVFASAGVVGFIQPKIYRATTVILLSEARQQGPSAMDIETPADIFSMGEGELPVQLRLIKNPDIGDKVRVALKMAEGAPLPAVSVERVSGTQKTNLLALSCDGTDPKLCRDVANEWVTVYADESKARSGRSLDTALQYITTQLQTIEEQLDDVEMRLAGVQNRNGSLQGESTGGSGSPASDLEAKLEDNLAQQAALQAKIGEAEALLAHEPRLTAETREEPTASAQALKTELARLTLQRQQMLESYRENTPEIQALDERIGRLERQLKITGRETETVTSNVPNDARAALQGQISGLKTDLAAAQAQGAHLREQMAQEQATAQTRTDAQVRYAGLQRSRRVLEETHSMLLSRLYELRLQKEMETPGVQIVQAADVPSRPIKPQMQTLLGLGLILGLLLGIAAAGAIDQIADTFADVDEIGTYTGLRILGVLPYFRDIRTSPLTAAEHTRAGFANAARMLVSNLRFLREKEGSSSIVVTSAGKGEGKTTATINLAIALAAAGEDVLVVDGDLHRPTVHRAFGLSNEVGLSSVLIGVRPIEEATQPTSLARVSVMASGPLPPSPTDILASEGTAEVMRRINQSADIVLWDTPPAALLPDASIAAANADAVIFVLGRDARRRMVRQSLVHLRDAGCEVLGAVANQTRPRGGYYYYSYHSYYGDYADEDVETDRTA
ncbi:MAG: polysaccharide biosynthesis tyrosine autokinase [Armatimonadetes bacterium]|nr:polysaccharide biosynthesis tyrosine autokinase [Armatimonadota bacterium]